MKYKDNRLKGIKSQIIEGLQRIYPVNEARNITDLLIEHFFGLSKTGQALQPDYRLTESELLKIHFAVKDLLNHIPVQYVLGNTSFMGMEFHVNPSVLIPRPETEELVHFIIKNERDKGEVEILDVGTGSGCIAVALKKYMPLSKITAIDISEKALQTARENAQKHHTGITFMQLDILNNATWDQLSDFDVIVSNPPYVLPSEKKFMRKNVLEHEPHEALFVPEDDPLLFYKNIVRFSIHHLKRRGRIYFEINEKLAKEVTLLLEKSGFGNLLTGKDIHGKERFVSGIKR